MLQSAFMWNVQLVALSWFSLTHKHDISITSENTRDVSVSISRRTNPFICLMLFSLAHKHKHKHKRNEHVNFVFLVLMLMRK